jgi:acetylornithine deacetylase/succinyl-diaminopimelate desuccinylase-like protein
MCTYVGVDGMPPCAKGGNVLRPMTRLKVSIRLPPSKDSAEAAQALKEILEANPPFGAKVNFEIKCNGNGFDAPAYKPEFGKVIEEAASAVYGKSPLYFGMGGSIPLMSMLASKFPKTHFMVTGVLGPKSNAHGPNEFLHLPFLEKMTNTMVRIMAEGHSHL